MIFTRSNVAPETDYNKYKEPLRKDFKYRCAYCLRLEDQFGGHANGEIDHFCPQAIDPTKKTEYNNCYWTCHECNNKKWHHWPKPWQSAKGFRFIDPCVEDFDKHMDYMAKSGALNALTAAARYTIWKIRLNRPELRFHRRRQWDISEEINILRQMILSGDLSDLEVEETQRRIHLLNPFINPPIFRRVPRAPMDK
ncbi:MAG: hypothetical protein ABIY70_08895 [Capsulimonas sp.]|uniref:hypothetical protein n=1 Tax=Capsulimonas sp. TaxID=2494211 RepID=UPI0032668723